MGKKQLLDFIQNADVGTLIIKVNNGELTLEELYNYRQNFPQVFAEYIVLVATTTPLDLKFLDFVIKKLAEDDNFLGNLLAEYISYFREGVKGYIGIFKYTLFTKPKDSVVKYEDFVKHLTLEDLITVLTDKGLTLGEDVVENLLKYGSSDQKLVILDSLSKQALTVKFVLNHVEELDMRVVLDKAQQVSKFTIEELRSILDVYSWEKLYTWQVLKLMDDYSWKLFEDRGKYLNEEAVRAICYIPYLKNKVSLEQWQKIYN